MRNTFILLHNIRSTHNVGSMFRTADAAGVSTVYLSGYTPTPIDRFGREVKELSKVALGGELSVKWEYIENPVNLIKKLKKENTEVIAIEQAENSVDYKKVKLDKKKNVLFVVGNEVDGVEPRILKLADVVAEIPMKGEKESLNVGVSFGIALFRMLNI